MTEIVADHQTLETHGGSVGNGRATGRAVKPKTAVSRVEPSAGHVRAETHTPRASGVPDDQKVHATQSGHVVRRLSSPSEVVEICEKLVWKQRARAFCIKRQSMANRSTEAFIALHLGYATSLEEKKRKEIFKKAAKIREAGERDEDHAGNDAQTKAVLAATLPIIVASKLSREVFDKMRADTEAEMRRLAKTLPAYRFVHGVKGIGALGLAIVIGEAAGKEARGDLAKFATISKLWKRLGLAVLDGVRQGALPANASKENWIRHGYNRRRRAEIWAIFSDSMFRHQWAGAKDIDGKNPEKTGKPVAVPAHPTGPYGEVYAAAKAKKTGLDGWSPGHCHDHARRVMTKAFIKHLWLAWRKTIVADQYRIEPRFTVVGNGRATEEPVKPNALVSRAEPSAGRRGDVAQRSSAGGAASDDQSSSETRQPLVVRRPRNSRVVADRARVETQKPSVGNGRATGEHLKPKQAVSRASPSAGRVRSDTQAVRASGAAPGIRRRKPIADLLASETHVGGVGNGRAPAKDLKPIGSVSRAELSAGQTLNNTQSNDASDAAPGDQSVRETQSSIVARRRTSTSSKGELV